MGTAKQRYTEYLASPQWKELRAKARERSGHKCEFCNGSADHVHHVKYPKRYKEDHLDNLVVACESCHSKLHGIRDDQELYAQFLIEPLAIGVFNNIVTLKLLVRPFPKEIQSIHSLNDKDLKVQEYVRKNWPSAFDLDSETEIEVPFTHQLFGEHELADQLYDWLNVFGAQEKWLTPEEFLNGFFVWISPGPSYLLCNPPSGK